MNKPVNPCRVNGVDCPKRHGGCAVGCKEWQAYEAERDRFYKRKRTPTATEASENRIKKRQQTIIHCRTGGNKWS